MESNKPLILVTNDDGIEAAGIKLLADSLEGLGQIVVVAPDREQSAVSNALTIQRPIRVKEFRLNNKFEAYSVDGTPTDCIKLAYFSILNRKPDIVISGINHGLNTAVNVLYSGTVSGAIEGSLIGVPSIAISHQSHNHSKDLSAAGVIARKVAYYILNNNFDEKLILNINVPDISPELIKGTRITRLCKSEWLDKFEKRFDPWGNTYYWFSGEYIINEDDPNSDDNAINDGYISITPLDISFTNYKMIEKVKVFENL